MKRGGTSEEIPCFIFDDHNEALQTIYRQMGRKKLPLSGMTLLHYDSHPDMAIPHTDPLILRNQPRAAVDASSIEDWILPAVYAEHIDSVIWIKPPWAQQMEVCPLTEYHIGTLKEDPSALCVTCPESYFVEDGFCASVEEMDSPVAFRLAIEWIHQEPSEYDNCHLCQQLLLHLREKPFILDIDLDTFTCCNPLREKFTSEQVAMIEEIYGSDPNSVAINDPVSLSREQRLKYKQLGEWLQMIQQNCPLPKDQTKADKLLALCNTVRRDLFNSNGSLKTSLAEPSSSSNSGVSSQVVSDLDENGLETFEYLHYLWRGGWDQYSVGGVPHQLNDLKGVQKYVEAMENFLVRLPHPPQLITISRSHKDGYVPEDMIADVEETVVLSLIKVFGEDKVTFYPSYAQTEASGVFVPRPTKWKRMAAVNETSLPSSTN